MIIIIFFFYSYVIRFLNFLHNFKFFNIKFYLILRILKNYSAILFYTSKKYKKIFPSLYPNLNRILSAMIF